MEKEIDLDQIDSVIACRSENDHSGALPELIRHIPDVPIYCTKNGEKILKGLKFKNKKAGAFRSYGWSGEAVKLLSAKLTDAGFG